MTTELVWMGTFLDLPRGPYVPGWTFYRTGTALSSKYRSVSPWREPIYVVLPDRMLRGYGKAFCIDSMLDPDDPDSAWEITIDGPLVIGQRPLLTLVPKIDVAGSYRGLLRDGVLSDDEITAVAYV